MQNIFGDTNQGFDIMFRLTINFSTRVDLLLVPPRVSCAIQFYIYVCFIFPPSRPTIDLMFCSIIMTSMTASYWWLDANINIYCSKLNWCDIEVYLLFLFIYGFIVFFLTRVGTQIYRFGKFYWNAIKSQIRRILFSQKKCHKVTIMNRRLRQIKTVY